MKLIKTEQITIENEVSNERTTAVATIYKKRRKKNI